jgi:hypothetical protein
VVSKKSDLNRIVRYCTQAKVVFMDRNDVRATVHVCLKSQFMITGKMVFG